MPDLDQYRVSDWLTSVRPAVAEAGWPPPIRPLERAGDTPDRLVALGRALDAADPAMLAARLCDPPLREAMRDVLAQLGAARLLRITHWLAQGPRPHRVTAALTAGTSPEAQALRSALRAVASQAVLQRMVSPARVKALAAAAQKALKETA